MPAVQAIDDYKPLYNDGQMKDMDEQYGKVMGPGSQEEFDMDKLGDGAAGEGGWTMSDEYDAPSEEYGDDRPDADKVSGTCPCRVSHIVGCGVSHGSVLAYQGECGDDS